MRTYQSVLPAATRISCKVSIGQAAKSGYWFCFHHGGVCERIEGEQGQPAHCNVCGSPRIQHHRPVQIDETKMLQPEDLRV